MDIQTPGLVNYDDLREGESGFLTLHCNSDNLVITPCIFTNGQL